MAARLLKVAVVETEADPVAIVTRWINPADVHEAYATTYTIGDEKHEGTMVRRFVGQMENEVIAEALSDFAARVNALTDCPPCPDPNGKAKA